jgi:hypothetical protein
MSRRYLEGAAVAATLGFLAACSSSKGGVATSGESGSAASTGAASGANTGAASGSGSGTSGAASGTTGADSGTSAYALHEPRSFGVMRGDACLSV